MELRAGDPTLLNDGSFSLTGSLLELALRGAIELFFGFIGRWIPLLEFTPKSTSKCSRFRLIG